MSIFGTTERKNAPVGESSMDSMTTGSGCVPMGYRFLNGTEILDTLRFLRATTKRSEKEAIIEALAPYAASEEFFEGVKYAYQGDITFGVKQVPEKQDDSEIHVPKMSWLEFKLLLNSLNNRTSTGGKAQALIEQAMAITDKATWNEWYRPILMKDLKIGCSETTTNKILKKLHRESEMTEVYKTALAEHISTLWAYGNSEALIPMHRIPAGEVYADIKLNGIRINAFIDPGKKTVTLKSREGRVLENFSDINKSFEMLLGYFTEPVMVDGEVMSKSFQQLMTQVNRKMDVQTKDCVLFVFDIVPVSEFLAGESTKSFRHRLQDRSAFQSQLDAFGIKNIKNLTSHLFDLSTNSERERLEQFRQDALTQGYEGLVLKLADSKYRTRRTFDWLAYKPTLTLDLTIVGMEEGGAGTKNEGSLGALICEGYYESGKESRSVRVKVGNGFKPDVKMRRMLWDTQAEHIGQIIEVKCDEVTKAMEGDYWSLRFPRFMRFRGTKPGEKI